MQLKEQILKTLRDSQLPDYYLLASPQAIALYPQLLPELLAEAKTNFTAILKVPEAKVNFTNSVEAYLNQDEDLGLLFTFLNNLNSTDSADELRTIITNFQPQIIAYANEISMHPDFYRRVKSLYAKSKKATAAQKRSMELIIHDMEFAGVHLSEKKKSRLAKINTRLGALSEQFQSNVLDDRKRFSHHFASKKALAEVPAEDMAMAQEEAKQRKKKGFVFTLSPPSYLAIMKYCSDAAVRKKFWLANARVSSKGKFDNRSVVLEILQLRAEKAKLLGKKNYAEYILTQRMAKKPQAVLDVLTEFSDKSLPKAKAEFKELTEFAGVKQLKHWDAAYYAEKMLEAKFAIDEKQLKPYFLLENVLQGMFAIYGKLLDLHFKEVKVKSYAADVRTFEVWSGKEKIAYYIFDPFARPQKRGGAWCNDFRTRRICTDGSYRLPIAINVANFAKSKPALLTHRDVETIFHEFGHALHLMLDETDYVNLSGFHTEWDFVELPSQLLENWTWEKEGLDIFAKHHTSGKSLPEAMITKLQASRTFLKGMFLLRQNEFGFLDFLLHSEPVPKNVDALEVKCHDIANTYSIIPKPISYKMFASFSHIFGGGYAAGYYSYLWAEILEAEVFEIFKKAGILNPKIGRQYHEKILAPGTSKDGLELFIDFVGHPPKPDALLKKLGITEKK